MACPNCGAPEPASSPSTQVAACRECGTPIGPGEDPCPQCGAPDPRKADPADLDSHVSGAEEVRSSRSDRGQTKDDFEWLAPALFFSLFIVLVIAVIVALSDGVDPSTRSQAVDDRSSGISSGGTASESPRLDTQYVLVNSNVRSSPSTQAEVLGVLERGRVVVIEHGDGPWRTLFTPFSGGFVYGDLLGDSLPSPEVGANASQRSTAASSDRQPATSAPDYFTIGSSKGDVRQVMGTPSSIRFGTWTYGFSTVQFDPQGRVTGYHDISGNLKVRMVPKEPVGDDQCISVGDGKDHVLGVMGTPSAVRFGTWTYGFSTIRFDMRGRVAGYNDISNNLNLCP